MLYAKRRKKDGDSRRKKMLFNQILGKVSNDFPRHGGSYEN